MNKKHFKSEKLPVKLRKCIFGIGKKKRVLQPLFSVNLLLQQSCENK